MTRNAKTALCLASIALMSGSAMAEFMTTGIASAERRLRFLDSMDSSSTEINATLDADPFFGTGVPYDLSIAMTGADHPLIDTWDYTSTGSVLATSSLFAFNFNAATTGRTVRPTVTDDNAESRARGGFEAQILVTEATEAIISFEGMVSEIVNGRSRNQIIITVSSALGSFVDFSAGFNSGASVTEPFSFSAMLLEGDTIEVTASFDHRVREDDGMDFYQQDISASFSIEAVPAPGSCMLLGAGGLLASRRRR